jgi:hypothetical protein
VKRQAKIIRSNEDGSVVVCIDVQNYKPILEFLTKDAGHKKKFNFIVNLVLQRIRNTEVYDKEDINKKSKGVTAMKFFKGQSNDRIYCKEQTIKDRTFVIIMAELLEKKKSQGINQKTKNLIEKVAGYEYEIIE